MEILKKVQPFDNETPIVFGVFEEDNQIDIHENINYEIYNLLSENLIKKDLGCVNQIFTFNKIKNKSIFLIGLGKKQDYNEKKLEIAAGKITEKLNQNLIVFVDSFLYNLDINKTIKKLILTIDYYDYKFDEYKSKKNENKLQIALYSKHQFDDQINEYFLLANAISNTRDLINKPYNYLNAEDLANYAISLVDNCNHKNFNVKILGKKEIEALGMGAFLGVNKGSETEPKLVHITYQGRDNESDLISLIGKGVMFDTGGYSLKQNMTNMKDDMGGAATVLGIIEACAKNNLKINLQTIICATDNKINSNATLPDDVLTAMNKKTIEIISTDAEGRLTLADALTYAQQQGSKKLIDIATLTGSVVTALGDYTTGIFGNNKEMIDKIIDAGESETEHIWEMPITDHIRNQVRSSKVADIKNSTGRLMGASSAAAFLEEFVEDGSQWIHLDIAGTVFRTSPSYSEHYGASGVMVKTIYQYLKKLSE